MRHGTPEDDVFPTEVAVVPPLGTDVAVLDPVERTVLGEGGTDDEERSLPALPLDPSRPILTWSPAGIVCCMTTVGMAIPPRGAPAVTPPPAAPPNILGETIIGKPPPPPEGIECGACRWRGG